MNKIFNIANGDCLAEQLKEAKIARDIIICREALIKGSLQFENLDDFWKLRADFISNEYSTTQNDYYEKVVVEFKKIINIPENSEANLWFEDDLFCQVNLWFCILLLSRNKDLKIYRIFPKSSEKWKGFSTSTHSDLEESLYLKVLFNENDIELALKLWRAFQNSDSQDLKELSKNQSLCFRNLEEVIDVYLNKKTKDFIENLIKKGVTDFNLVFEEFQKEFGALGYGDLQVKEIYNKALK
ncbi:DUF1835 domain-containing protein [Chryseobacterium oryctis]|uniref:DUF1835 domain-containing protein n=1 Tax=Chryseobacterium oryctis TaxID=2952618 RepID=A0ABT3HLM3_9FLAO|nr:DUF1835 domain-containing protein [Chryseobacterium oryctis]MCW3160689.1 DUF1835 domain-containing protein [Chryseobacterium oryctis]